MAKRAIINADDFGWSAGVTDGIVKAHREGVLTSTTLAVNMPDAARAAQLAQSLPTLGVGVHLNACQGSPLTEQGRRALAEADGVMRLTGPQAIARCIRRPSTVAAVLAEFEAQIRRALELGIRPTHLDSHRHVHAWPHVAAGVAGLAKKYDVPYLRRPSEHLGRGWPHAPAKQVRTALLLRMMGWFAPAAAMWLQKAQATWGIAHTGSIDADWLVLAAGRLSEGLTEIMVHPGFPEDLDPSQTRLLASRRTELDALCAPEVRQAFSRHSVELVHYGQLGS